MEPQIISHARVLNHQHIRRSSITCGTKNVIKFFYLTHSVNYVLKIKFNRLHFPIKNIVKIIMGDSYI